MKVIPNNFDIKIIIKKYFTLIGCLFIAAINFNLFLNPLKIVTGGLNGISILLDEILRWSPSWTIFAFSIITLVIGFFILGVSKTVGAIVSTFLYPFFVNITSNVGSFVKIDTSDLLMVSIFAGIVSGLTTGYICKVRLSQGGIIFVSESIARTFKISISRVNFFVNAIIVIAGGFSFGFLNALYAIIILFISSVIIDRILLGVSDNKFLYIMTSEERKVKDYIYDVLEHGVTSMDGISGKHGNEKKFLMTVVPTNEYVRIMEFVKKADDKAFVIVTDTYRGSKI